MVCENQARMHLINNSKPYQSSTDGIAHFPETPTAIGVRLNNGLLEITAPYGINRLVAGIVSPTPYFQKKSECMRSINKGYVQNSGNQSGRS